jgi:hypothetical protein
MSSIIFACKYTAAAKCLRVCIYVEMDIISTATMVGAGDRYDGGEIPFEKSTFRTAAHHSAAHQQRLSIAICGSFIYYNALAQHQFINQFYL